MSLKVLIVEDESVIALDLKKILGRLGYDVVGSTAKYDTALDMLFNRQPDLVLLDINIKGTKSGIDIAELINEKYKIPFVYITSYSDETTLNQAKLTRPFGYLLKPFTEENIKSTLAIAIFNYKSLKLNRSPSHEYLNTFCSETLSKKEFEVVLDILGGHTTPQIASGQNISINTVKFHLRRIYAKMGVSGKLELLSKMSKGTL